MIKSEIYSEEFLVKLWRTMVLIRRFEEKIIEIYALQDMRTPVHLCIGQEAVAAGVCANLRDDDYIFTTHRGHGHCLAKGMKPYDLYAEFYGRADGCCQGRGGSMHPVDPTRGILGTSAIVGGAIPIAVGAALAAQRLGTDRVSVVFFGDGASDQGVFHESLNFASLKNLPVIFVCENNYYAVNSPLSSRQPDQNIARFAAPHLIPGMHADGADVLAVYEASKTAVERARKGEGPTLLEFTVYRWKGHVGPECDHEKGCRPMDDLKKWMARCPLEMLTRRLAENGIQDEYLSALQSRIDEDLDLALRAARDSSFPDPSTVLQHVYRERT